MQTKKIHMYTTLRFKLIILVKLILPTFISLHNYSNHLNTGQIWVLVIQVVNVRLPPETPSFLQFNIKIILISLHRTGKSYTGGMIGWH